MPARYAKPFALSQASNRNAAAPTLTEIHAQEIFLRTIIAAFPHTLPFRFPNLDLGGRLQMKIMGTWNLKPGGFAEAVRRFLAGQATPPQGVTLLGRWHSTDLSIGFTLIETSDPALLYSFQAPWTEVLDLKNYLVIEDNDAG